jgi:hypothetical protein
VAISEGEQYQEVDNIRRRIIHNMDKSGCEEYQETGSIRIPGTRNKSKVNERK